MTWAIHLSWWHGPRRPYWKFVWVRRVVFWYHISGNPTFGGGGSIVYVKEMIKMNETRRNGPELPEGKLNRPHLQVGGDVETWGERERWRDWDHLYKSHLLYTLNGEIHNCFWGHHWCWKTIFIERWAKLVENENFVFWSWTMEKQSDKGKLKGWQIFIWALLLSCLFELMHFLLCFGLSHKNIKMGFGIKR